MNNKKILLGLLLFSLILIVTIIFPLENVISKRNSQEIIASDTTNQLTEFKVPKSKTRDSEISESEFVVDINDNTFLFTEIIGEKTLYFRFSESGCSPCISE